MKSFRYIQYKKAQKIIEPWVTFPAKRIYDKRRSARVHRKACKADMSLWEYSRARLFGYV